MAGVVGDDLFGHFMRDSLAARGVDVRAVRTITDTPTGLSIHLIRDDDRAIITNPGTIPALRAEDIDADLLASARHVHVAAYFLQSGLWPGLAALLGRARAAGATISLDPNWDPAETWDQGLPAVYGLLDMLLPNDAEVVELAAASQVRAEASKRRTAHEAAQALAMAGPGSVVVKLGAQGALAACPGEEEVIAVPAVPGVRPVDTVGAGDSFDAGFIAATLWGWDTRRALALGAACGALSTRSAGGSDAQATREEAIATAGGLIGEVLAGR
jgi:sugar/nucleoside kinase (ribokinase family)